jgi:thiol-disulfide isomerase/thioredoxin
MAKSALKIALLVLLLLALIAACLAGYYFGRVAPLIRAGKQQGVYSATTDRPDVTAFGYETLDGQHRTLAALKGKVVVVDVWATWCGTCIVSIPKLIALQRKYQHQPVEIIGVDVDDEGGEKVMPFLKKHPEMTYAIAIPYPAASFQFKTIVDMKPLGNVSAIPTIFVIDRQGRLAGKFIELGHEKEVDDLVASLLTRS